MDLKNEIIHFPIVQQKDEKGTKLEPEETVLVREGQTEVSPTLGGNAAPDGKAIPVTVQTEHSALEVANALVHKCAGCKFFNLSAGQKFIRHSMHPGAPREAQEELNKLRIAVMTSTNLSIQDAITMPNGLESADELLLQFGRCERLTEIFESTDKQGVFVAPNSCCPPEFRTAMHPHGFYKPLHAKDDSKVRDAVLLRAARKL